jgi:MFS family permease
MTTATRSDTILSPALPRPKLVTFPLLVRFATMLGASFSFYLLLSVVPLYTKAEAGGSTAGISTGVLMITTVIGELVTPRLVARYGYRLMLAMGLTLLGAPAFALAFPASLDTILAVCAVRGLGFALIVVAGGSLTASLIPPERRAEGLALAGLVAGVPALVATPLGLWLADRVGYPPVFIAGGAVALVAIAVISGLPGRKAADPAPSPSGPGRRPGVLAGLRSPDLLRPAVVFAATTTAAGILVTFLPLAVSRASGGVIALALFAQPAAATLTRYVLGRFTDRCGPERLIVPGLVIAAAGMAILALTSVPAMAIVGSVVFGAGFGLSQNATLSLMYARVPESQYVVVSAVWNIAYDAGMGLGAAGFGLLAAGTGYSAAFLITAAAMLVALIPALRDRKLGSQETKTATSRVRPRPPLDEQRRRTRRESRAAAATALTGLIPAVQSAGPIFMITYFPVVIISGVLGPISGLPHWLVSLASYLPAQPLADTVTRSLQHVPGARSCPLMT